MSVSAFTEGRFTHRDGKLVLISVKVGDPPAMGTMIDAQHLPRLIRELQEFLGPPIEAVPETPRFSSFREAMRRWGLCPTCKAERLEPCRKTRAVKIREGEWLKFEVQYRVDVVEPLQWRRSTHVERREAAPGRGDVVALLTRATVAKK